MPVERGGEYTVYHFKKSGGLSKELKNGYVQGHASAHLFYTEMLIIGKKTYISMLNTVEWVMEMSGQ